MNLESLKIRHLANRTQWVRIQLKGTFVDSCETLFVIPPEFHVDMFAFDLTLESLREVLPALAPDEPLLFPAINAEFPGRTGTFDYEFIRDPENENQFIWILTDFSREYAHLREMQQERNESLIEKERVALMEAKTRLEKDLLEMKNSELERNRKFRMEFFSRISHEFRTPVNGIIGLANLLGDEISTARARAYLEALESAGKHLVALVNDLMDVGKIEAGKLHFESIPFNLRETIQSVTSIFEFNIREKDLYLNLEFDPDLPQFVVGDPLRLNQILFNLIGNAVKFTVRGGVDLKMGLLEQSEDSILIQFRVRDTGIGIPVEKQASVFELYDQGGTDVARKYGGTGLGLSIVRQLVEMQGGKIEVFSEPDKGAEFRFTLVFRKSSGEMSATDHFAVNATVLMVEDHVFNQKVIQRLLEKAGCRVMTASEGAEALKVLETETVDLVLTDLNMPGMGGMELLERIRRHQNPMIAALPVIALSGSFSLEDTERIKGLGFTEMLRKPVDPDAMGQLVREFVRSGREVENTSGHPLEAYPYLVKVAGEDFEFMLELTEIFIAESDEVLERMKLLTANGSWPELTTEAHRYKSNARYMNLEEVFSLLERMERLARNQENTSAIPELITRIEQNLEMKMPVIGQLREYLVNLTRDNPKKQ